MTYVNKGQFYNIILDHISDHCNPLKCTTVRSRIMILFRGDNTDEEEIKMWRFWH